MFQILHVRHEAELVHVGQFPLGKVGTIWKCWWCQLAELGRHSVLRNLMVGANVLL